MNYKYFIPAPQTAEELKSQYRKLAFQYHPDCGGTDQDMKAVNNEYDALFPKLKDIHQNKDGEKYTARESTTETAADFKNLIAELMKFDNIEIEVIGCFIWLSGNTKPYKERLKELRFNWHSKKLCWYLKPEDYRRKSRRNYDLDEIRNMYGSSGKVYSNGTSKLDDKPPWD